MGSGEASWGARTIDGLRGLVWLFLALIAVGLAAVAAKSRVVQVDSWPVQPADGPTRNLAHLSAGTLLSASTFDVITPMVHPLYAIDGDSNPPLKWQSDSTDHMPWLRLTLAMTSKVDSILLAHAPTTQQASSPRGYTVTCLASREGGLSEVGRLHVVDTEWQGTNHRLDCAAVDELRIDFDPSSGETANNVGLYEITAMGHAL